MRCDLFVSFVALLFQLPVVAAEPQWIWRHQDAATKAEKETVYFRRAFDVQQPDGGFVEITADNRFEVFLNGRRIGSGDNWQQRFKFDIGRLLLPGRNLIAVSATNADVDAAGLAVHVLAKDKGKEPIEVSSDASWKWSTKVPGTWTRLESDDSQWEQAVVLGAYGRTAPWGAAGPIVEGKPAFVIPNKPRSREKGLFEFRDGDRVVLLGSAFIERLQNTGYLETVITAAFPHKKITFRNLGWSGDTVWGDARAVFGTRAEGFQRLVSDVTLCDPTVLIVCYGENEAHAGQAGLADFRAGLNTLLDSLEATGARIVLLGPRQHENLGPPLPDPAKYNADLRKYNDVIEEVAKERGHTFVNLYDFRKPVGKIPNSTVNGFQLNPTHELSLAYYVTSKIGDASWEYSPAVELDLSRQILESRFAEVSEVVRTEDSVSIVKKDRGLLHTAKKFSTANLPAELPPTPPSFGAGLLIVAGLDAGEYRLEIDGKLVHIREKESATADMIALGVDTSNEPATSQFHELNRLINEKNTLFFHRYRPQNETYLFLFRKHEQGNNAVEIPQFDPLIEELEKKIDELKKPVKQKIELIKVK